MKLSLCPRSSFPTAAVPEPAPSDEVIVTTSIRVDTLPARKTARSGGWLQTPVVRNNDPGTES